MFAFPASASAWIYAKVSLSVYYFEEEMVTETGSGVHLCLSPQECNNKSVILLFPVPSLTLIAYALGSDRGFHFPNAAQELAKMRLICLQCLSLGPWLTPLQLKEFSLNPVAQTVLPLQFFSSLYSVLYSLLDLT